MIIHTQKGGKGSTTGLILIATELIKMGYTVRIRHVTVDGKNVQAVEAEGGKGNEQTNFI